MEVISLIAVGIILFFSSEHRSHRIKVTFLNELRERKDDFLNMTPEPLINGFEGREHPYLLPHNKIISKVHVQVKPRRQHKAILNQKTQ